jgi:hypothetical protein
MMSDSVSASSQGAEAENSRQTSQWSQQLDEKGGQNGDNGWRVSDLSGSSSGGGSRSGFEAGGDKANGGLSDEDMMKVGQKIVGNFAVQMMKNANPMQAKASFE